MSFSARLRGVVYLLATGVAVALLAYVWRFETPPPDVVGDIAAAAGLRAPLSPLSMLWHAIASPLYSHFGVKVAGDILRIAGHVSLGALAVLSCAMFTNLLPASFKRGQYVAAWWRVAKRVVLYQAVAVFCLSNPVWRAFRWFSPASLHVLMAAAAAFCIVLHFRSARLAPLFAAFAISGALAADTPAGAFFAAVAVATVRFAGPLRNVGSGATASENPIAYSLMSWRLTLAFFAGFAAAAAIEVRMFAAMDGLAAFGWKSWTDYALAMPAIYIKEAVDGVSPLGVLFFASVAVLPFAVAARLLGQTMDDERHLRYLHGCIFAVLMLAAFSQLCGIGRLWFWTWAGGCVDSLLVQCTAVFMCSVVFMWALAVFTLELYLRNFRRVETLLNPDAAEAPGAREAFASEKRMQHVVRTCFLVEPLLVLASVVPPCAHTMERAMLEVAGDAARETARECDGVDFIFTDGGLDALVELAAAIRSHTLRALSMMGAGDDPREVWLRTRGAENAEDRKLLEIGAADALRTWVRSHPEKASSYAVQIGFELWRRDKRPMPRFGGMVARPEGMSPEEASRGAAVARSIAERILDLYAIGDPDAIADRGIRDAFIFAQWRIAVIARLRANEADASGDKAGAIRDSRLADSLDACNDALGRIRENMSWAGLRYMERLTPQEGVRLGLARANFAFARVFALRVLDVNPDDAAANFALGMDYFVQRQYARAEGFLERCLVQRPDDPAVLNNLAQCRLRRGDAKGALPYARKAIEILPDSPEIKRTIERIYGIMREDEKGCR